ncbi:MAG: serine hydrolase [Bacteroidota bacterium]
MNKIFLLCLINFSQLFSQSFSLEAIEKLNKFIESEMDDKKITSLSISIVNEKNILYENGFGFADKNKTILTTPHIVYRVGSISKIFTAIAAMQLSENGILNIDAPIQTQLPNFHPKNSFGAPITLRQMMSHRSGLVRESPIGNYFDPSEPSLEKTVLSLNNTEIIYAPQTKTKYSNAAVATVGYAIQQKSGIAFDKYMKDSVLKILGMKNSTFIKSDSETKNLANSIMWSFDQREFDAPVFDWGMFSAANLFSTTHDLAKFLKACFNFGDGENGSILNKNTIDEMKRVQFSNNKTGFGLGFFIGEFQNKKTIEHGGVVYGFATSLIGIPEENIGVIVASNVDVTNIVTKRIADYALNLFFAEKNNLPLPNTITLLLVPKKLAKSLQGQYKNKKGEYIEMSSRPYGLQFISPSLRGTLKLHGDTLKIDDRQFFGIKVAQFKNGIIALGDTFQFIGNPKPKDAPNNFKGLIGEYGYSHLPLFIYERFGKLSAIIELTETNPLDEISKNEFAFPTNYNMYESEKIIFKRDKNGKAISATTATINFPRRKIIGELDETFSITPLKTINELENIAKNSTPPIEEGKLEADLVEISSLEKSFKYDIRYASPNNFMRNKFYSSAKAFLQKPAADALIKATQFLKKYGYGILVFDAYRPWYVTKMFWEGTPTAQKIFVADPEKGSRHNRGCAIDISLYDLKTGKQIEMVGQYDEMSERSFPDYVGGTSLQRWHRELLRTAMEENGFDVYEFEWWHFDFRGWKNYPILNKTFEEISN